MDEIAVNKREKITPAVINPLGFIVARVTYYLVPVLILFANSIAWPSVSV